jgi:quinolinate synthase
MLHQLTKANPLVVFDPVNRAASCKYMKMITPSALLRSLQTMTDEVTVPADVADRARQSVERMIAIGSPSRTGE